MIRWWDNSEQAQTVLERVDGSDVVQGVGTAMLAYHAVARNALVPLATETLVSQERIREALSQVDTSGVARAFAAATEPVMGGASEKYGQMLAEELHQSAINGVDQMVRVWTAGGVGMPLAVERASQVVGIPSEHLGRYTQSVKAPVVPRW